MHYTTVTDGRADNALHKGVER